MQATMFVRVLPLTVLLLLPTSAFAQNDSNVTPAQLVDALNAVFGKQTDNRAVHAKGVVLEGKFTPSPEAASLSKAPHLQSTAVPVTIRFSDFAGVPAIPDTDPKASPRGLAVKFHLPDGVDTDLVTHSYVFDRARLAPGQTVLIHGAARNVGAYAVQFARMVRARVIATASKGTSITSIASTPTRSSTSVPPASRMASTLSMWSSTWSAAMGKGDRCPSSSAAAF